MANVGDVKMTDEKWFSVLQHDDRFANKIETEIKTLPLIAR